MEKENKFFPLAGGKEYGIKEPTGSVYKKVKMLLFQSSSTTIPVKKNIANEFKMAKEGVDEQEFWKEVLAKEIPVNEFYEKITAELFLGIDAEIKFDDIRIDEVNRATNYFFELVNGN